MSSGIRIFTKDNTRKAKSQTDSSASHLNQAAEHYSLGLSRSTPTVLHMETNKKVLTCTAPPAKSALLMSNPSDSEP